MKTIKVKRIKNQGIHGEYPAMQNVETGRIYVDTCLGMEHFLSHDKDGYNRCSEYVGFNIPGAWCTFHIEPECPLRHDIQFELVS